MARTRDFMGGSKKVDFHTNFSLKLPPFSQERIVPHFAYTAKELFGTIQPFEPYFMPEEFEDRITIEEPPIQKITKKKSSCFKRTCFNGCGCLILLIVGSLFFLKFIAGPSEKSIAKLPDSVRQMVPLYDEKQISNIRFYPGAESKQKSELLTFFPKLIVSPLVIYFPHRLGDKGPYTSTSTKKEIFYGFMREPIGETRDIYTIEWKNLSVEPRFIAEYYQTELKKKSFVQEYDQKNGNTRQMLYSTTSTLVNILIEDPDHRSHDTDSVTMTISQNVLSDRPAL